VIVAGAPLLCDERALEDVAAHADQGVLAGMGLSSSAAGCGSRNPGAA